MVVVTAIRYRGRSLVPQQFSDRMVLRKFPQGTVRRVTVERIGKEVAAPKKASARKRTARKGSRPHARESAKKT